MCGTKMFIKMKSYLKTSQYFSGESFSNDFLRSRCVGDFGAIRNGCGGISGMVIFHDGDWSLPFKSLSIDSKRLKLPVEVNKSSDPEC